MSRIVLARFEDTGQEKFTVGWDHPADGAFWQEFNKEPTDGNWDNFEEVSRSDGMWPGIPLDKFRDSVPEDLRPMITDKVMEMLERHSKDPDSGYNKGAIDLSDRVSAGFEGTD